MSKRFKNIFVVCLLVAVTSLMASWAVAQLSPAKAGFPGNIMRKLDSRDEAQFHVHVSSDHPAQGLKVIALKTTTADVKVRTTTGSNATVIFDGEMPGANNKGYTATINDGTLTIETLETNHSGKIHLSFSSMSDGDGRKLEVLVPQSWHAQVKITTISGDINVEDITLATLETDSTSGNVELGGVTATNLKNKSISGDLSFDGEAKSTQVTSVSGDVDLNYGSTVDKVDLESISGDIALALAKHQGASFDVTTISGDIKANFALDVVEKPARKYAHGKLGDGNATILVHTVSGDFHLDVED